MLVEHAGKRPTIHSSATVAPTAVLCGDVTIGPQSYIGFGAVLTAETGPIRIGRQSVVMEYAVLRGTKPASLLIGTNALIGPHAHLSGCQIDDEVFIATHASVFPHASIGRGSAVRIGAVVHIRTRLPPGSSVPIGWIAVGDPPALYSPAEHEAVLAHLSRLDFSATVFGVAARQNLAHMPVVTERYTKALSTHRDDRELVVDPASGSTP